MGKFSKIREIAVSRHGEEKVAVRLAASQPRKADELAAIPDDRFLSMATRCIFQSGFNWKVIEAKWEGFEEAFEGFALGRWVMSNDDDLARLVSDRRIVRNGQKIASVPQNARFFAAKSSQAGSVGRWIGDWPATDQIGLLREMAQGGSRLGAATGQYFLRFMGRDTFILSRDATAAMIREGVIDKPATSARSLGAVQAAFNSWMEETGLPLSSLSQVLAMSIDG
ncbi:MAG: DNA-3-methyladenine glycosylase I [Rhizobiaceae bacterium]